MNVNGVKRFAKIMMKGNDLAAVVVDQKSMQELINGKLVSSINNVSLDLLKWSYNETNYAIPDVFSAWSDLDSAFTQLIQEYMEECSRYRKTFKDITAEAKMVAELQREKDKSATKVSAARSKLENAKKTKKLDQSKVNNLETELYVAQGKDGELAALLRNKLAEFEMYKCVVLKESMTAHCHSLTNLLEKGKAVCEVKLDVISSMPSEPALTPDSVTDNHRKVDDIFNKFQLQLPPRDPAFERNLPAQKFKSLPPPQTFNPAMKSPRVSRQPTEPMSVQSQIKKGPTAGISVYNNNSFSDCSDDDENDYMTPDEEMLSRKSAKDQKAPQLPPRNVIPSISEEDPDCGDMYVIPTLSPTFKETEITSEYFEVDTGSDEDAPVMPPSSSNLNQPPRSPKPQVEKKEPVSEPLYFDPDSGQGDFDELYGNMTNDENKKHKSVGLNPAPRPVSAAKLRRPAVFPKKYQKVVKEIQSKSPESPKRSSVQVVVDNDDDSIYSCVYEDDTPYKSE